MQCSTSALVVVMQESRYLRFVVAGASILVVVMAASQTDWDNQVGVEKEVGQWYMSDNLFGEVVDVFPRPRTPVRRH